MVPWSRRSDPTADEAPDAAERDRSETFRRSSRRAWAGLTLSGLLLAGIPAVAAPELAAGDRAWETRAEILEERLAASEGIEEAIRLYGAACETAADRHDALEAVEALEVLEALEACWKLLRAYHYLSEFTTAGDERKDEAIREAVSVASTWIEWLEQGSGSRDDRAQLYFWSAIVWGARGQRVGLLTIVREGVARRMHDYALRAVELDPEIERGGGFRLLSRLHAGLPRVPFISGWVDRDQVLPLAERALAADPADLGNHLVMALGLLERAPERSPEAVAFLDRASSALPRPALLAEDLSIRQQAIERLAELEPRRVQPEGAP